MSSTAYSIVEFLTDDPGQPNEVGGLPTNWISSDKTSCLWPPANVNSLIKNPNSVPDGTWDRHPIVRIFATCGTYAEVSKLVRHFEVTSEAEVEEVIQSRSRGRTKRFKSSYSVNPITDKALSDYSLPHSDLYFSNQGPKLGLAKGSSPSDRTVAEFPDADAEGASQLGYRTSLQTPPSQPRVNLFRSLEPSPLPAGVDKPYTHHLLSDSGNATGLNGNQTGVNPTATFVGNSELPSTSFGQFCSNGFSTSGNASQTLPQLSNSSSSQRNLQADESAFQSLVLRRLAKLESNQADILGLLHSIAASTVPPSDVPDRQYFDGLPQFPITKSADLTNLEQYLTTDEDFIRAVKYFSLIGGNTTERTVKGILKRLLSRDFALTVSFTGKGKDNLSFEQHGKVLELVIAATRRNEKTKLSSETDIKRACMDYFRFLRPSKQQSRNTS